MNEREVENLLNDSDFDFSGDDDDEEYMPPDFARTLQKSEEIEYEEEEARPAEVETEEEVRNSTRLFWRTKEMTSRGHDIEDDVLIY
ncbi:unnamed protein product [Euphydryas editha]|uniref:Uncharacterized protein n=1 Tax=Euphydryas editha TaxID=104508 RepID=A0AAU9UBD7_EUPED|nr:unnamed protein product [Euphydryas editha]